MSKKFKLVAKNGTEKYEFNKESGRHEYVKSDWFFETSDLCEALISFLEYVNDGYNESKVSLILVPEKKVKKLL